MTNRPNLTEEEKEHYNKVAMDKIYENKIVEAKTYDQYKQSEIELVIKSSETELATNPVDAAVTFLDEQQPIGSEAELNYELYSSSNRYSLFAMDNPIKSGLTDVETSGFQTTSLDSHQLVPGMYSLTNIDETDENRSPRSSTRDHLSFGRKSVDLRAGRGSQRKF